MSGGIKIDVGTLREWVANEYTRFGLRTQVYENYKDVTMDNTSNHKLEVLLDLATDQKVFGKKKET